MPTDLERLVVSLEARTNAFEKAMVKANAVSAKNARAIETRWNKLNLGANAFSGFAKGATATLLPLLSITAAIRGTQAALEKFGAIADQSAAAGLDPETYQAVAYQAKLAGVEIGQMAGALATFNKLSGQAVEGRGKLVSQLKAEHGELLKGIQATTTQEQRFRLVADAIKNAKDQSAAAAISVAAFGDAGTQIAVAFKGGSDEIDRTMAKARELGIIVSRDVIARADELGDKWETVAQILDNRVKSGLIDLGPLMVDLVGWAAQLSSLLAIAYEQTKGIEERRFINPLQNQLAGLEEVIFNLKAEIADLEATPESGGNPLDAIFGSDASIEAKKTALEGLYQQAERLQERIAQLQGKGRAAPPPVVTPPGDPFDFRAFLDGQYAASLEGYPALFGATTRAAGETAEAVTLNQLAIDQLNNSVEQQRELYDQLGQIGRTAIEGIVDAMSDGKVEGKELQGVLSNILGMAGGFFMDKAFGGFGSLFGGGATGGSMGKGLWGSAIFGGARANGGPVQAGRAYVVGEKRPELFVPRESGFVLPKLPTAAGGAGGAGGVVHVHFSPVIDARGMNPQQLTERLRLMLNEEVPRVAREATADPHKIGGFV